MSRTCDAVEEKSRCSSSDRPKSFTRVAPATLKRSVICVFRRELRFICSRAIVASFRPTRLAGKMNSGSTISVRIVSFHSR